MASVLDIVAEEAVTKAIGVVARRMVGDQAAYEGDYCRELVRKHLEELMKEPEVKDRLRTKLVEVIAGLPDSLPVKRGY